MRKNVESGFDKVVVICNSKAQKQDLETKMNDLGLMDENIVVMGIKEALTDLSI